MKNIFTVRADNSLYLDTLCVDQGFHDQGIGSELISLTRARAVELGLNTLSLIVLADNTNAQRLYKRHGFDIAYRIEMDSHELIPHEGGAYLMTCRCI